MNENAKNGSEKVRSWLLGLFCIIVHEMHSVQDSWTTLKLISGRKVNANKTEKTSSLQARAITDHDQNDPKNDHVDQNCLNDQDDQYQH